MWEEHLALGLPSLFVGHEGPKQSLQCGEPKVCWEPGIEYTARATSSQQGCGLTVLRMELPSASCQAAGQWVKAMFLFWSKGEFGQKREGPLQRASSLLPQPGPGLHHTRQRQEARLIMLVLDPPDQTRILLLPTGWTDMGGSLFSSRPPAAGLCLLRRCMQHSHAHSLGVLPLLCRWLVYSKPFFDDDPYVLEPGGYPNLQAWGAKDPSVCSMHPIKLVSPWQHPPPG